jgi:hypothetical protein
MSIDEVEQQEPLNDLHIHCLIPGSSKCPTKSDDHDVSEGTLSNSNGFIIYAHAETRKSATFNNNHRSYSFSLKQDALLKFC